MQKIQLTRTKTGWNATYSGAYSDTVFDLFGTRTLPLPYTAAADPADVLATIAAGHPDHQVVL